MGAIAVSEISATPFAGLSPARGGISMGVPEMPLTIFMSLVRAGCGKGFMGVSGGTALSLARFVGVSRVSFAMSWARFVGFAPARSGMSIRAAESVA